MSELPQSTGEANTVDYVLEKKKPAFVPLAFRPREAARALGLSERTLWSLTKKGSIPHVRVGRAILYSVDGLRDWLTQKNQIEGAK